MAPNRTDDTASPNKSEILKSPATTMIPTLPPEPPKEEKQKESPHRRRKVTIGAVLGAIILLAIGIGSGYAIGHTSSSPTLTTGAKSGFDSRTPGVDKDGHPVPFINLGTILLPAYDYASYGKKIGSMSGFNTQCGRQTFLWVVGDFTSCSWARGIFDALRRYSPSTNLGYDPSFNLNGTDVYCHFHSGSVATVANPEAHFNVWECRANGGKQFAFKNIAAAGYLPPCWDKEGKLKGNLLPYRGNPIETEIPRSKPQHLTSTIGDCKP